MADDLLPFLRLSDFTSCDGAATALRLRRCTPVPPGSPSSAMKRDVCVGNRKRVASHSRRVVLICDRWPMIYFRFRGYEIFIPAKRDATALRLRRCKPPHTPDDL